MSNKYCIAYGGYAFICVYILSSHPSISRLNPSFLGLPEGFAIEREVFPHLCCLWTNVGLLLI